jgi:hypothetical protein
MHKAMVAVCCRRDEKLALAYPVKLKIQVMASQKAGDSWCERAWESEPWDFVC